MHDKCKSFLKILKNCYFLNKRGIVWPLNGMEKSQVDKIREYLISNVIQYGPHSVGHTVYVSTYIVTFFRCWTNHPTAKTGICLI